MPRHRDGLTLDGVPVRLARLLAVASAALLLGAVPALASPSSEVASGQSIATELQSGKASCKSFSTTDFEHLGEYVMQRMLGSSSLHQAMNARMDQMTGPANADRMHQTLGRSFAGCLTRGEPGYVGMGTMGGNTYTGDSSAMMASTN
jgi:hypothetical protein